jgi:LPS-assembly protein
LGKISLPLVVAAVVAAAPAARAADPPVCEVPPITSLDDFSALTEVDINEDQTITFEAGSLEAQIGSPPTASLSGGVLIRRGSRLAGADSARFIPETQSLELDGEVRYEDPQTQIIGDRAEFSYSSGHIEFNNAEFLLGANGGRGAAGLLAINQDGTLNLAEVTYTTCPPESDDWRIEAGSIVLDTSESVGTARNVKLRFKGVPILYSPYLSFPLTDARKSGILTPTVGTSSQRGNELAVPWYWNIAENYDATITPRWLSDRGMEFGSQFRYLTQANRGSVEFDYLANDKTLDTSRHLTTIEHQTLFANGIRNLIDFREVSDNQYFEDLGGSLSISSITHLNRSAAFDYFGDNWAFFGRIQDYQTLDESIGPLDEPYQRLPQLLASASWPDQPFGLRYNFGGELVNFDRSAGVTGWRMDLEPEVELAIEQPGWFITPAASLKYTRYDLSDTAPGQPGSPDRLLPIASIDTGILLERSLKSAEHNRIQTLEPRMLYVHVPFRDQEDLPVFDTIVPDLNLVQLYRKNRYLGVDRLADTDQLSIGITSRILDVDSGRELMSATIGQALYLSEQGVSLPGQPVSTGESSDYIAEIRFLLYENINFDLGHQWSTGDSGTSQSEARLQYRPQTNKIVNLAYRFRRDSLEQGDVSWSWPVTQRWNFVGRYNYSFRDDELLERFFGLEYESCCWGLRVVSRRHLSTRDGTQDSSFGLQLVLKGMTSLGTGADRMLERGILGYSPNAY